MLRLPEFSFVVFDCDGVILDSNAIKTEAFWHALMGFPKRKVEALVDFHRKHGGVSRYEKIRYFFESLLNDPDQTKYKIALERFQQYCQAQLRDAPLVPGVVAYLQRLRDGKIPMFVVSGSDETELKEVLRQKQILPFFERVLGSPTSKRENLKALLEQECRVGPGIFFGDAQLDYDIAAEHGLNFVFLYGYSDWIEGKAICKQRRVLCVPDFRRLAEIDPKNADRGPQRSVRNRVP
jgi:phosphoglycolate phosphatase-like HAD superfamily hydrolase